MEMTIIYIVLIVLLLGILWYIYCHLMVVFHQDTTDVVTFDYYGGDKAYGCVAHDSFCLEDLGLKDMDEVKILILKK